MNRRSSSLCLINRLSMDFLGGSGLSRFTKLVEGQQVLAEWTGERGFTLVELIVIMILAGILSIIVVPRFMNPSDFDARGFFDATESILRYAQKSAIAQRRNVCVAFSAVGVAPATVTLTIASLPGGACDTPLTGPNGIAPHRITAAVGVTFSSVPAYPVNFTYLSSGSASSGASFTVASRTGTVSAATGYVHH